MGMTIFGVCGAAVGDNVTEPAAVGDDCNCTAAGELVKVSLCGDCRTVVVPTGRLRPFVGDGAPYVIPALAIGEDIVTTFGEAIPLAEGIDTELPVAAVAVGEFRAKLAPATRLGRDTKVGDEALVMVFAMDTAGDRRGTLTGDASGKTRVTRLAPFANCGDSVCSSSSGAGTILFLPGELPLPGLSSPDAPASGMPFSVASAMPAG